MKRVFIVTGLGWGDEGKGSVVDALCRKFDAGMVVRHCGGAQSAHNVVTQDGRHHCFSQFGSGALMGATTYIHKQFVVDPVKLLEESSKLERLGINKPLASIYFNPHALVVTPYHKLVNRCREIARGNKPHGSCGMGIGETVSVAKRSLDYCLRLDHLFSNSTMRDVLHGIECWAKSEISCIRLPAETDPAFLAFEAERAKIKHIDRTSWASFYSNFSKMIIRPIDIRYINLPSNIVLESSQGMLLDADVGFAPHNSWTSVMRASSIDILNHLINNAKYAPIHIGVMRSYLTRHGAGPFPTEDAHLTELLPDKHNQANRWQGPFRVGFPDRELLKYASYFYQNFDFLAVTNLDRYIPKKICSAYKYEANSSSIIRSKSLAGVTPVYSKVKSKAEFLESLDCKIGIESYGETADDKVFTKAFLEQVKMT